MNLPPELIQAVDSVNNALNELRKVSYKIADQYEIPDHVGSAKGLLQFAVKEFENFERFVTEATPISTLIDVETYEEYDYTDTEMLEFVFSQEDTAAKLYMAKHVKTGKWAYSDKGPVLTDEQWDTLDWYDTFRDAIQAEIKKAAEAKK